ncbi:MAG: hypothetical protein Q8Q09_24045 [Deltaproteobacteria bacterium]|nr:hypothetical protein [Deltaproteobacteria bacterium]
MKLSRVFATLCVGLVSTVSSVSFAQSGPSIEPQRPSEPSGALDVVPTSPSVSPETVAARRSPEVFELNPVSRFWAVRATAELGVLSVVSHTIQLSQTGSTIDYVREGGQNNLALFARVSAEVELGRHHNFVFLYQPIDLRTQVRVARDLLINNVLFARGTGLDLRYGFDFYRLSYMYDFFADPNQELSVGATFQLRNAAISFTSTDGVNRVLNSNVGLVPALKARGRYTFRSGVFMGFEVDGIYANIPGLNGSDIPVEGAILDGSIRAGLRLWGPTEVFVNLRYLGGGSRGVGRDVMAPGDGYVNNWFHTMAISIGANVR